MRFGAALLIGLFACGCKESGDAQDVERAPQTPLAFILESAAVFPSAERAELIVALSETSTLAELRPALAQVLDDPIPPSRKDPLLGRAVAIAVEQSRVDQAQTWLDQIRSKDEKARAAAVLAGYHARAGDIVRVDGIAQKYGADVASLQITRVRARLAKRKPIAALRLAARFEDREAKQDSLEIVALALTKAGRDRDFETAVRAMGPGSSRDRAHRARAEWLFRRGRHRRGRVAAREIETRAEKSRLEVANMRRAARSGFGRQANKRLAAALEVAREISDPLLSSTAVADVGRALAEIGQLTKAQEVLLTVARQESTGPARVALLDAYAKRDRFADAQKVLAGLRGDLLWAGEGARALAKRQAEAGDWRGAYSTVAEIGSREFRWPALGDVVGRAADAGVLLTDETQAQIKLALRTAAL